MTAFGVIVRADNVRRLTREGWCAARDYGVGTILDLRSEGERLHDADVPSHFDVVAVSLFDDFDSDPDYREDIGFRVAGLGAAEAYRVLYTEALDRNSTMFAEALNAVACANGAVLMHCVGGKDRTGLLAALLSRLAGVTIPVADEDYRRSEARLGLTDSAPAGVMDAVLKGVDRDFGNAANYFSHAGATESTIDLVRMRLRDATAGEADARRSD
jgi:protein-tyrosine phosphatase